QLKFKVAFGDVDVSVFPDFKNPAATRCELSANNGPVDEVVTLPGTCPASPGNFQVEVRAVVNSSFTIEATQAAASAVDAANTSPAAQSADDTVALVAGPPALQTAIEDDQNDVTSLDVYLPFVTK